MTPPTTAVRLATIDDREGIIGAIRAVYDEYGFPWYPEGYHRDLYDFQSYYLDRGIPFWVAMVQGGVRGAAALMRHPFIPPASSDEGVVPVNGERRVAGTDASLERVYVHPSARRLGLARRMNEAAIAFARAEGVRGIEIWSDKRFEAAHALYQGLGAILVGERLCHDPEQSPEWGFRLDL